MKAIGCHFTVFLLAVFLINSCNTVPVSGRKELALIRYPISGDLKSIPKDIRYYTSCHGCRFVVMDG